MLFFFFFASSLRFIHRTKKKKKKEPLGRVVSELVRLHANTVLPGLNRAFSL